ncbi:DUF1934 domain-containing protein [Gorillibacterium timonense]|uniref:DUF1934 domain-containing protein n=1 Tax=Gorillibacterium timonense TaxID=1689269 RepID=UPI00131D5FD9|nr:DUF1934 domain-containing protein [Gorillibacterium timonense]
MVEKTSVMLTVINDSEDDHIRLTYRADRYTKGVNQYFRYQEQEDMGQTFTLLKIGPDEIRIVRQGDMESEQAFAVGEIRTGYYRTAQGLLSITTRTSSISVQLTEGLGTVFWDYELQLAGEAAGEYRVTLDIRGLDEEEGDSTLV